MSINWYSAPRTTQPIVIGNSGQSIKTTNYWTSHMAKRGMCFLSINAGAVRLLLPKVLSDSEAEILTGKSVTLEPSVVLAGGTDVVFDDGTAYPFCISLSPGAMDFKPRNLMDRDQFPFTVWTETGLLCSFVGKAKYH